MDREEYRVKQGILYGVGIGPGDPELITLKAVRVLESCPVIACPQTEGEKNLALDIIRDTVNLDHKQILHLPFGMKRDPIQRKQNYQDTAALLLPQLQAGQDVAMITLGDVSLYSTFGRLQPLIEDAGFQTCMIPGVPSFCAVSARLGTLLAEGRKPLHILPVGGRDWEKGLSLPGTKVLMKAGKDLEQLVQVLKEHDCLENASFIQNCGLPEEVICRDLTGELPKTGYFTTMVIQEKKGE